MTEVTVSFPLDVWRKAKSKADLQAWVLTTHPELSATLGDGEGVGSIRYTLDFIVYPKKRYPILLEFSDEAEDDEVIALIPEHSFFASGHTPEAAKANLLRSMEDDYSRLRNQGDRLGRQLLSKLEFLEELF